jgi:hypothetical protein
VAMVRIVHQSIAVECRISKAPGQKAKLRVNEVTQRPRSLRG